MSRMFITLLTVPLVAILSMCSAQESQVASSSETERIVTQEIGEDQMRELSAGNSAFAFDLYKALREDGDNIFFSPYSISAALAMAYAGAEGVTETEMAEVLHFTLEEDRLHPSFNFMDSALAAYAERDTSFSLHIVNALWGQTGYSFLPDFLEVLAANYGAGISLLDFSNDPSLCRSTINEWVAEQTSGKIEDLIPPGVLSSATKLVLTNAIYFKAQWLFQFDEYGTSDQPFHLMDGTRVAVPTMSQTEHFLTTSGDGYSAVQLPYTSRNMSMLVILPDTDRFLEIEERLCNDFITEITGSLRDVNLYLSMPKFETVSSFQLENVLPGMGMASAFGMSADFSGMDGERSLYIASVIHKAFVSVDENGTEAAAATAVVMNKLNGESCTEFSVNRPFIYLLRDRETGSILFIGRIMNPIE